MIFIAKASAATALAFIAVLAGASAASANTAPNSYTPTGSAWINVPAAERVYLENFGLTYDDTALWSIPTGVTCTRGAVTADGPFLTGINLDSSECVDATLAPYDPIDDPSRLGAVDLGFAINFYGTTYTNAWPSTNGGLFFDSPNYTYDSSTAAIAAQSGSAAMLPLGGDLYYENTQSNFWTAQTTVGGRPAVVFSWERFHNCCNDGATAEDMSVQLVLISVGSGDFNAQFNYSSFAGFTEGYDAPTFTFDLATGVTPGSNVVVADDVTGIAAGCRDGFTGWGSEFGTATDTVFASSISSGVFFSVVDATAKTVALWSDVTCTTPVNVNFVQDIVADGYSSFEFTDDNSTFNAVATGWGSYSATSGQLRSTELVHNLDTLSLENGQPGALNLRSLNSAIAGQFIIGQRAGVTVTDPVALGLSAAAAAALANTGLGPELAVTGALVAVLLLAGAAILIYARRKAHTA